MPLHTDSRDYDVLQRAAEKIKGIEGLTCEVGLREGGGSKYIIDALLENDDTGRTHIAIDPYGSIPYIQSEIEFITTGPYPNRMMKLCLSELYDYILDKDIEFLFFQLEDTEFFDRYHYGIPIYKNGRKSLVNVYALTYLDGPHNLDRTLDETEFFAARTNIGGVIVYDDIVNYYDHDSVKDYLLTDETWQKLEVKGNKISYIKISERYPEVSSRYPKNRA